MSRRSPSPAVLLAVLLVLVCAAGCGGLPTPAGVRTVRAVAQDSQRDESTVREIPAGPFPQESALETARGFLAAGGDLDVLTRFLAPGTDWDPYAQQTVVYEGSLPAVRQPRPMAGSPTRLTTSLTLTGVLRIDPDGTTSPVSPSAPMTVAVGLVQSATGEWRVDAPPPVVLVRDTDLAQGHRRVGLGWLAPGGQTLVTEPVLLAVPEGALGPAIVTALLAGPPQRLRAVGVTSAIPAGTRARRVAQEGTALLVDLDSRARPGTPGDVPLLRAQLAATLLPAFADAGVTSITLTVADQPLAGAGASSGGGPITSADAAPLDPETDPAGLAPQALNARGQLSAVARAGPRPVAAGSPVVALAVDADGKRSAQLTGTSPRARVPQLVIAGEAPIDIEQAGPWTSVAFGPASSVWLVGPGIVRVRSGVGRAAVTTTTVTPTVPLRKLVIDPDGVHAVGVTTDGGIVAGLVALPAGGPPVLDLRPVSPGVTDAVDIGLDSTQGSVIVLRKGLPGETPAVKATPSVARVQVAAPQLDVGADLTGAPQPLPAPCGSTLPTSITGRAAVDPLVGCSGGTVVELSHDTWANAGVGLLPSWPLG